KLRAEGERVGLFRPITLWPSPEQRLFEIGKQHDKILVAELNKGQYRKEVERVMRRKVQFLGKVNGRPLSPGELVQAIKEL
ncbi:MAG: 2-oxoacid:acceptor oxidoreductase subunit alpha, partial [Helicobacter sp.]|nr:2-oxoacid:acceptor oxidoreductase subunit alpha [Helicobacter sp.]